uniref:Uncharacterized protein n=1 Tax=Anguilla anguilla TaxID=7936 RepID=A0A0E9T6D6_ANGAN
MSDGENFFTAYLERCHFAFEIYLLYFTHLQAFLKRLSAQWKILIDFS